MKKVLIFLLTMVLLVNTVAFAATMIIPSDTSPDSLSAFDGVFESVYGEISLPPENNAESGGATITSIYKHYLIVSSFYDDVFDNTRNRISVYDVISDSPNLVADWNLGEIGIEAVTTSSGSLETNQNKQNTLTGFYMDENYIYMIVAQKEQYLYIATNTITDNPEYDEDGNPIFETPTLVASKIKVHDDNAYGSQTWLYNQLPVLKKTGNDLIYIYGGDTTLDSGVVRVNLSDINAPAAKPYLLSNVLKYTDPETGDKVTFDGTTPIMGAAVDGTIGYILLPNTTTVAAASSAYLFKVNFKRPEAPYVMDVAKIDFALADGQTEYAKRGRMPVQLTGGYIYLSPLSVGTGKHQFWKINPETMEIVDYIEGNANLTARKFCDTGDMLLAFEQGNYKYDCKVIRFGEKDEATGYTASVEAQPLTYLTNRCKNKITVDGVAVAQLNAFIYDTVAFGNKIYLQYGITGMHGNAANNNKAVVGYIDMSQWQPYMFTINPTPIDAASDSYTVSGYLKAPSSKAVGVHLYINGSTDPVEAAIDSDDTYNYPISTWSYTLEGAGTYNVVAKLYDKWGEFDEFTESVQIKIKSTTGLNAETSYSVISDEQVSEIPETVKILYARDYDPETRVTGYRATGGYLATSITNRGIPLTTGFTNDTSDYTLAEDGTTKIYTPVEQNLRDRNQLIFWNLNEDGSLGDAAKVYDGIDLNIQDSTTVAGFTPGKYLYSSSIIGMTMDDNYLYCYVTELVANHSACYKCLYVYKNPYNKASGTFDEEVSFLGRVQLYQTFEPKTGRASSMEQMNTLSKISYDGKDYICIADNYNQGQIPFFSVADVTDPAKPAKKINSKALNYASYNGLALTAVFDAEFDGRYAYISGYNKGTYTAASTTTDENGETVTVPATLEGAYFALMKIDFIDPLNPEAVNAWKLMDIPVEYVSSSTGTTSTIATIDISGGKVITTLSNIAGRNSAVINEWLGTIHAYVLDGTGMTKLYAPAFSTGNNAGSATKLYGTGCEHVYYADGMYLAETWNSTNAAQGGIYLVFDANNFDDIKADPTKWAYHSKLPAAGRLISGFALNGRLYTNHMLYASTAKSGEIGCMNFTDLYPLVDVEYLEKEDTYYANIELENNASSAINVTPVAALYKNGRLIDINVGSRTKVGANTTITEKLGLDVPADTDYSGYTIRTFVFDTIGNIKPLVQSMSMAE